MVLSMPSETSEILRLENICKAFAGQPVLTSVNTAVRKTEVLSVIGYSGTGKTTLLRCMALLEPIDSGTMKFCGQPVVEASGTGMPLRGIRFWQDLAATRQRIGFVFQDLNLWSHKTVLQNVIEGLVVVRRMARNHAVDLGKAMLEKVGLSGRCDSYPKTLSGGQQRRVAIARALVSDPELLLLDEITSGLDPELVSGILNLIGGLADNGTTIVTVSHELSFVRDVSTRVLFLHNGRVEVEGTPGAVFEGTGNAELQQFLHGFRGTHYGC
jgi:polar amino acid transport system ATP-binding protein